METPQRCVHEAIVDLLVVDREERGQQSLAGGEPHCHQDSGPEIGDLDTSDAELVVQPGREADHGSRQNEADEWEEPGSEADGDPIDDRPGYQLRKGDHERPGITSSGSSKLKPGTISASRPSSTAWTMTTLTRAGSRGLRVSGG